MSDEVKNTGCFVPMEQPNMKEANDAMEMFQAELVLLCTRFGIHCLTYGAGIACSEKMPGLPDSRGTVVQGVGFLGCVSHGLATMAVGIGDRVPGPMMSGFLQILEATAAARSQRAVVAVMEAAVADPVPESGPDKPTPEDLLNMQLPGWAQKKVQ